MVQNSSEDSDMGQITNGSCPDYIPDVYYGSKRQYTKLVGEIKIEATKIGAVRGLYRMVLFSKEALGQRNVKGVMRSQTAGNRYFVKIRRSHSSVFCRKSNSVLWSESFSSLRSIHS